MPRPAFNSTANPPPLKPQQLIKMRIAFSVKLCDGFQGENKICLRGKIENCMCPMGHREVEKSTKNQKITIKILLFEYIGPKLYFIHS